MHDITRLLDQAARGDKPAENQVFEMVYAELHRLAALQMHRERGGHSLQPTALVHEAYLRLVGAKGISWQSRTHFYNAAAQTMRRILIDHARAAKTNKRQGGIRVELEGNTPFDLNESEDVLAIDAAIDKLREMDARAAQVVELRFFAGLNVVETAEAMGISEKTVKRDWAFARAWLENELKPAAGE